LANDTLGVLLAGGQSLRMGQADKFLLQHNNRTLLQHCLDLARPQVGELVINANGDPTRLANYMLPIVPDLWPDHPGPLAGIISVMSWAQKARKRHAWLATFATDTPNFPAHLVLRLRQSIDANKSLVAVARSQEDAHYTFALWSMSLLPNLLEAFNSGERSLHRVIQQLKANYVFFAEEACFFNLNTPDDWDRLKGKQAP